MEAPYSRGDPVDVAILLEEGFHEGARLHDVVDGLFRQFNLKVAIA